MNGKDGWMDGQYGWMDRMDGRTDGSLFPFRLKIPQDFFFGSSIPPQTGRIEDLRKEFLWNLQSSLFNPKASRGLQICIKV